MKKIKLMLSALLMVGAVGASAGQLAGKNIILVQGFQLQHIFMSRTHDEGKRFGYNYWNRFGLYNNGNGAIKVARPTGITLLDQNVPFLSDASGKSFHMYDTSKQPVYYNDANAKILHFDSTYRLEEPNGQGNGVKIARQLNELFARDPNYCKRTNGCIVVTHSTGDLVMQYLEDNKRSLLNANARNAFDVITYIDLAGARGGTEGAVVLFELVNAVNKAVYYDKSTLTMVNSWLNLFFGTNRHAYVVLNTKIESGILYNLQPKVAKNTGLNNPDQVPHLRVASAGNEPYGFLTKLVIKGESDSVVPLHSACGSTIAKYYNSCVKNRRLDGQVVSNAIAPDPKDLHRHHYPFIQSKTLRHNGHQWDDKGNKMTPLRTAGNFGDINIDVDAASHTSWFKKYILIKDADKKTLAQVLTSSVK